MPLDEAFLVEAIALHASTPAKVGDATFSYVSELSKDGVSTSSLHVKVVTVMSSLLVDQCGGLISTTFGLPAVSCMHFVKRKLGPNSRLRK